MITLPGCRDGRRSRLESHANMVYPMSTARRPMPVWKSLLRQWLIVVGIWTAYGFWCGNQTFFEMKAMNMDHPYWRMILWGIGIGNVWSLLTPAVLFLTRRFPFERSRIFSSVPVHVAAFAGVWLFTAAMRTTLTMVIQPFEPLTSTEPFAAQFQQGLVGAIAYAVFLYAAVVGIGHAIEYRRLAREKALRAAQLESMLAKAQVLSLKMQLHPHFLFNTLNGVVALVREGDNDGAVKMLLGLSNMLRYALDSSGRQEVPLSEELEFLNLYVGVEQMRFPDRLTVEIDVDPETNDALVPSLMLQPIVENAIRHGIAPRLAPGKVRVAARKFGDNLVLNVEDDGVGLKQTDGKGIGLQNTRSRLTQLYQSSSDLQIKSRSKGGVEVSITLPFRTVSSEAILMT
jgi:two-component system, LytTR family, sensor kinase